MLDAGYWKRNGLRYRVEGVMEGHRAQGLRRTAKLVSPFSIKNFAGSDFQFSNRSIALTMGITLSAKRIAYTRFHPKTGYKKISD
jgi:hypothetical protein